MAVNRQNAYINQQLELGIKFRYDRTGELFDPYSFVKVEIIDSSTEIVLETIQSSSITRVSKGVYKFLTQQHSIWNTTTRTIIDKWYFIPHDGSFEVTTSESTVIKSESLPTSGVPTPNDIRSKFLRGIQLYDECGEEMSDEQIQEFISASIDTLEKELGIDILPRVVRSLPKIQGRPDEEEKLETADIWEAPYNYYINDYYNWGWLQLFRKPVQSIEKVEFIYPTGQRILTIPTEWIKLNPRHGMMNLVPTAGTLSQVLIGQAGIFLPMLTAGLIGDLPALIHVDYITGFGVRENYNNPIPSDMYQAISKLVCIDILQVMSDAIAQGVISSNISADGLNLGIVRSNSQQGLLFQGRIESYLAWLEKYYDRARRFYYGIGLGVV